MKSGTKTRTTALASGVCLAMLVTAGCGNDEGTTVESAPASTERTDTTTLPNPPPGMSGDAFGLPDDPEADAFTYDEAAVPVGSTVDVESEDNNGRTTVTLSVTGLAPNRDFGVHVHTRPCGPQPSDSGPHYQNNPDPAVTPESPSTDPAYLRQSPERGVARHHHRRQRGRARVEHGRLGVPR